jgi:caffeoyl-CoA O-methyltransferase
MLITPEILQYAQLHSSSQPQYLSELERETALKTTQPIMLSGALQGRFLSFISKLIKPTCILEIGTFTGFSALCLAEGLAPNGILHTLELNEELQHIIDKYIAVAQMQEKIKVHYGNALEIMSTLNIKPNLVFIDADKTNYKNYYEQVLPMLAPNGIILLDNMLYHGQVLQDKKSKNAQAIAELNAYLKKDDRVEVMLLPLRDGITMVRKL